MIAVNDIRIGNWVHHTKEWSAINNGPFDTPGFDFQWDERHWYMLGECTLSLDIIDPIPLTEEWLLKFGFVKDEWYAEEDGRNIGDLYNHDLVQVCIVDGLFYRYNHIDNDPFYSFKSTELPYVHTLQNYVYAISNTELTLN